MHAIDLIRKKRDGGELTGDEIGFLVTGAAQSLIPEEELAAWLMAVFFRGLSAAELNAMTLAMRDSGDVLSSHRSGHRRVDKHSTGGVGDKTSFLVAPIAAAAGLAVPMISGRALGHTGGTLDKLDSIHGYRTDLSSQEMARVIDEVGACIVGQTESLVPADRVLYALRDRTGTVESPALICASIMSKKLAEGLDGLVLDVKTGSGAFLKNRADGLHLASLMVQTGHAASTPTVAVLTSMDQPLGRFAGNWVEIQESIELLKGERHALNEDLRELSLVLAGWMLHLGDVAQTQDEGRNRAEGLLESGAAIESFAAMLRAQGGDAGVIDEPARHHTPGARKEFLASRSGFVATMNCEQVGWAVQRLGAGRKRAGEIVDPHAGLEMHAKLGMRVDAGQPLCTMFAKSDTLFAEPEELLTQAIVVIAEHSATIPALIQQTVTADNARQFRQNQNSTG
jgi:pyrimidine-nucleoside phosphorylase